MCTCSAETYEWNPLSLVVPSERDFDPYGGDLDAQYAWREFGGLSLPEAYQHFLDCPENRQEDFMFMGPKAFLFYFPVIERYLYSVCVSHELDYCPTWILGQAFISQLKQAGADEVPELRRRVAKLAGFVRSHLDRYAMDPEEKEMIDTGWAELEQLLG